MPLSVTLKANVAPFGCSATAILPGVFVARGKTGGDPLARILEHIGERLADQPAIAFEKDRLFGRFDRKGDIGMGDALQEHRLLQKLGGVLAPHHGRGHAREG